MKKHSRKFIHEVIEAAGGSSKVSRAFDPPLSVAAVSRWKSCRQVPADRVITLARMTRGQYTAHQIRPDVFPRGV